MGSHEPLTRAIDDLVQHVAGTDEIGDRPVDAVAFRPHLHVVFADPENPLFQQIRAIWPGVLIANPDLGWGVPLPADGGKRAAGR
ncbi:hypothetical protein [Nocardia sp. NPDC050710]|uniref:hypothetical protein n=1 Tax=Nocardia sp. NPDC050710 TaxID=3157220 RepID=UPI0033C200CF